MDIEGHKAQIANALRASRDSHRMTEAVMEMNAMAAERNNPAGVVFEQLREMVQDFESGLDGNSELGMNIVSLAHGNPIHVINISFRNPNLLVFEGRTTDGQRVSLVQHVSQLGFLLVAVPKINDEPYRVGFEVASS